ncbi:MAG: Flp pilus assembly protein CpaB [Blastocatellales bacterium]
MRNKSLLFVLAGAVIFGLIAAVSVSRYLSGAQAGNTLNSVVVAKLEIPLGARVVAEQLTIVQMPPTAIPEGAFDAVEKLVGRYTTTRILPRETITASRLAPEGSTGGLSAIIPEGYRAMAVRVDDEAGLAGFIMPGTLVDVLVVIVPPDGAAQGAISKIVLQNIKVLASGQNMDEPQDRRDPTIVRTVTLLVTPDQAEKLSLASSEGRLRLALRNSIDQNDEKTAGANKRSLLTGEAARLIPDISSQKTAEPQTPKPRVRRVTPPLIMNIGDKPTTAATPAPPRNTLEVYEGTKKRTVNFP